MDVSLPKRSSDCRSSTNRASTASDTGSSANVGRVTILPPQDDGDAVFIAQLTSHEPAERIQDAALLERDTLSDCHRETTTESISLFTTSLLGLVVSVAMLGLCTALFGSVFKQLFLNGYLTTSHVDLAPVASTLLQWPPVVSVVIGVVSDTLAASQYQYQRKSCLILGWLVTAATLSVAAAVSHVADLSSPQTALTLIVLSVVAVLGLQVVWIVSLAITVEYAQSESTANRGHFQGSYFLVYYAVTALTQLIVTHLLVTTQDNGTITSVIDLRATLVILAGCALVPIPFIVWGLYEHHHHTSNTTDTKRFSLKSSATTISSPPTSVWSYLQQKPVYRIYFFLCGVVFLVNAKSSSVDSALLTWCNIPSHKLSNLLVAQATPKIVAVALWKFFMINLNWRVLGVCGLVLYSLCYFVLTLTCGLGGWRDEWTYYTWTAVAAIPLGWFEVFVVVLPTEVASVGQEGLAMGMVSSFMGLLTILSSSLWESINQAIGFTIKPSEITADSPEIRHKVVCIGVVYVVINLSSVALAPLLPPQKLVAQQWRVFGDSHRPAAHTLVSVFVLMVLYNLVANWFLVQH